MGFPWEADAFLEEVTSEYPELANEPARSPGSRDTAEYNEVPREHSDERFEETDSGREHSGDRFEETDAGVEGASEVVGGRVSVSSGDTARLTQPKGISVERFFPDTAKAPKDEEGSSASGLLRTSEDISRIIALNSPRPGPFLQWFMSLRPRHRRQLYKGAWMLSASLLIVSLFSFATLGIFPLLEESFTATFGPRPDEPVRFFPKPGAPFGLVEDRPYRYDRFIAGMDCIWVTSDPVQDLQIADFGPYLEDAGEVIAVLDVQDTWNGMTRLYFDRGDVPRDKPVHLVIPIKDGGTIPLGDGQGYRLRTSGGDTPARQRLGPLIFKEEVTR